jgi:hypothetical protein
MSADRNLAGNASKGKELKEGDLVRYGNGATALMVLADTDGVDGTWRGPQCMGGIITQPISAMTLAGFKDRRTWVQHAAFRKQTVDDAMTQIGYVLGEEDPNDPAQPSLGTHVGRNDTLVPDQYWKPVSDVRMMHQKAFVDTPEALHDTSPKNVVMKYDDWKRHHNILLRYFVAGSLVAAVIGAIVGALVARLI